MAVMGWVNDAKRAQVSRVSWVGLAFLGTLSLAGCTTPMAGAGASCRRIDGNRVLQAELFFGRDIAGHDHVTDTQWSDFLRDVVTPRFPDGLSVLTALGQWRDKESGQITREPSFIVRILATDSGKTLASLAEIRTAYEQRFQQQSV